jgi:hypothetical protein
MAKKPSKVENQPSQAANPPVLEPRPRKLLYDIKETGEIISISRATVYRLLGEGKLRGVKAASKLLVTVNSIEEYVASLPPAIINPQPEWRRRTREARATQPM